MATDKSGNTIKIGTDVLIRAKVVQASDRTADNYIVVQFDPKCCDGYFVKDVCQLHCAQVEKA